MGGGVAVVRVIPPNDKTLSRREEEQSSYSVTVKLRMLLRDF